VGLKDSKRVDLSTTSVVFWTLATICLRSEPHCLSLTWKIGAMERPSPFWARVFVAIAINSSYVLRPLILAWAIYLSGPSKHPRIFSLASCSKKLLMKKSKKTNLALCSGRAFRTLRTSFTLKESLALKSEMAWIVSSSVSEAWNFFSQAPVSSPVNFWRLLEREES